MRKKRKVTISTIAVQILKTCLYYIPAIVFMFIYSTIPAIPFVSINPLAYIFVVILFVSGILLTFKQSYGSIIGILGCLFAVIGSYMTSKSLDMRLLISSAIICIYYIYCFIDISKN